MTIYTHLSDPLIYTPTASCHAASDGECSWKECPQLRDGEPWKTGRHCPIDRIEDYENN